MFNLDLKTNINGTVIVRDLTSIEDLSVNAALGNILKGECEQSTPPSDPEETPLYTTVDYLFRKSDGVETLLTDSVKYNTKRYVYMLDEDGRYVYYKVALIDAENTVPKKNQYFYYQKNVYLCAMNIRNEKDILDKNYAIPITDNAAVLEMLVSQRADRIEFFSIAKLNSCVVKLQRKYLNANINNCGSGNCAKGKSVSAERDFLFVATFILDHLIESGSWDEAEELLNNLQSCGSICSDSDINCKCNG